MPSADLRPLGLTLLLNGDHIIVLLTDARSVARSGTMPVAAEMLQALQAASNQLLALQAHAPGEESTGDAARRAARARELGSRIGRVAIPASVQSYLMDTPLRSLDLQLGGELAGIAWECVFNGHEFLGQKFAIARHLVQDATGPAQRSVRVDRDLMRVLMVYEAEGGNADAARRMAQRLSRIDGLSVSLAGCAELPREEILHRIENSDVVHFAGKVSDDDRAAPDLRDIAALVRVPALLVCHAAPATGGLAGMPPHHRLAMAAACNGLSLVVCPPPAMGAFDDSEHPDFVGQLYRALVQGQPLGRALREATGQSSEVDHGACGPRHTIYAESQLVLAPTGLIGMQENSHRQVTTMSYDLAGSTRLLATLGAEKYSELLDQYHARCARIVTRWGGMASNPQGSDGIMCYFGLPVAHEHSALQCLRSAVEILHAVAELGLLVRIGVVTGPVVVRAGQPVGVSIHLAARLQSIAEPGHIVLSESTHRLVQHRFDTLRLNNLPQLKGFEQPGVVYRLVGEKRQLVNAFDSAPQASPFVARQDAMTWLQGHWQKAASGEPGAVLVWGGAGIGKSRLVSEFKRRHVTSPSRVLECRCAPEHTQSAFHPLIDLLRRLFNIVEADGMPARLAKIKAGVAVIGGAADAAGVMAGLLSVSLEGGPDAIHHVGLPHQSAEKQRQRTLELLTGLLAHRAAISPVCMVFEDVQWLDPSTREFLRHITQRWAGLPLLVLLTQREDDTAPRDIGFPLEELELRGLSTEDTRQLINAASGGTTVPDEVVALLTEKADGVPLFIEESTRMVVELQAAGGGAVASLKLSVPGTIQDLLMARLDRLADAKALAQLGSVIGREFSLALMEAILGHASAPIRTGQFQGRLSALVASGLVIEKRSPMGTNYFFKHALVRDAAYQSLWERDRRRFHLAIALVLSEQFPDLVATQPEMAARHYAGAAMPARAIEYLERASRLALLRSAHEEAITHLASGLSLVADLPADDARDRAELRLQLLLAGQLIATEGYGAERVGLVYQRAAELCRASGDHAALLKVHLGLEGYYFMRADFEQAHVIARQVAILVAASPDPMRRLQATWALGNVLFHQGELLQAVDHMDACLADYRLVPRGRGAVQDPGLMCLCYSAIAKWELGHPDEALERARSAVALAAELKHKFSAGEAYGFLAMVQYLRGEFDEALTNAAHARAICEEGGFAVWLAHAKLLHGRALVALGDVDAGNAEMAEGYAEWVATGAMVTRGFYLVLRAEGAAAAGRPEEGLALLRVAMDVVMRCGERYYEAEIRRLTGDLLLRQAEHEGAEARQAARTEAQAWFASAWALAGEKGMASLSLRVATSQARLDPHRAPLRAAMDAVHGGRGTHDLLTAQALLETTELPVAAA